jgi:dephospho-CoA kinase
VLDQVRDRFGAKIIRADGTLDRAGLAAVVFTDPEALAALDAITGPAIARRIRTARAAVPPGVISVHDMPLLVERGLWVGEHLNVVVQAQVEERVRRLVEQRGLDEADARHRIAAQASDEQRRLACDVVLDNDARPEALVAAVDLLWRARLEPFNDNLVHRRRTRRPDRLDLHEPTPEWTARGSRAVAKLAAALAGQPVSEVSHIGSTSVAGLVAKDVIDVQVGVRSLATADTDTFRAAMAGAGYVETQGRNMQDSPLPAGSRPSGWSKRFWGGCDPVEFIHVHVREAGSPAWRFALLFRDWLSHQPAERDAYATLKRRLAASHDETSAYTQAKEPWFSGAFTRAHDWAAVTDWTPR